ncbi:MAG: UbiA family prenyltransferase [Balneolaceae bacterium]|nr:UbiA family prenyltransferase [Balneolaceae bacterium]
MFRQIGHFILHLRLHYQFLILSGGYLLGGLMSDSMDTLSYWMQFLNVHVLLYGGATAYNSWWDKDEGPIGGLRNPPKMAKWMHPVSLLFMFSGLIWAFVSVGWVFAAVYAVSLLLFWLYSTPLARWKGHPVLSMIAIGVSTGLNSVLLGALAAGGILTPVIITAAVGASLILLSLYPVSQIFQIMEDKQRGDRTFAAVFGLSAVKKFYYLSYFSGIILLSYAMIQKFPVPAIALGVAGTISGIIIGKIIVNLTGVTEEYSTVMRIKFMASLSFVIFLFVSNLIRHDWVTIDSLQLYF